MSPWRITRSVCGVLAALAIWAGMLGDGVALAQGQGWRRFWRRWTARVRCGFCRLRELPAGASRTLMICRPIRRRGM